MGTWTLGSITLPNPEGFTRRVAEKATYHEMINGTSKKDISSRKEIYTLQYGRLSQADIAQILAQFNLFQTLSFSVTDGDMEIAATEVHVDIQQRDYNTPGSEFREDVTIILTEVE